MLRIGLTGGIGSGKSTVAGLFAARGVPIVDTDRIAHQLTTRGTPAYEEIIRAFGDSILDPSGEIDRRRLGHRVFDDPGERRRLEAILHPRIRAAMVAETRGLDASYCVLVVPLLVEVSQTDLVDRVLVVDSSEELQIARVRARNGLEEGEIRKVIAAQASREERLQQAHDVITNDSDMAHLESEVDRLHALYLTLSRQHRTDCSEPPR